MLLETFMYYKSSLFLVLIPSESLQCNCNFYLPETMMLTVNAYTQPCSLPRLKSYVKH